MDNVKYWEQMLKYVHQEMRGGITAFDPGETTGLCHVGRNGKVFLATLQSSAIKHMATTSVSMYHHSDLWIIEEFISYPAAAGRSGFNKMVPAKIEGYLRAVADIRGVTRLAQLASKKEPYLKMAKEVVKHTSQHTADAHAHILAYLSPIVKPNQIS